MVSGYRAKLHRRNFVLTFRLYVRGVHILVSFFPPFNAHVSRGGRGLPNEPTPTSERQVHAICNMSLITAREVPATGGMLQQHAAWYIMHSPGQ